MTAHLNNSHAPIKCSGIKNEKSDTESAGGSKRRSLTGKVIRGGMQLMKKLSSSDSLGTSSAHSTNSFSTTSDNNTLVVTTKISCMKGSRRLFQQQQTNSSSSKPQQPRAVCIKDSGKYCKFYMIEPLFQYASDLWWTEEDINESKLNQQKRYQKRSTEKERLKLYLKAFNEARQQFNLHKDCTKDIRNKNTPQLSSDVYKKLVHGRSYGLAGLDVYAYSEERKKHIESITSCIIQAYENHGETLPVNKEKHCSSSSTSLSSYARSLTEGDRFFAIVLGRADMEAVQEQ